MIILLFLLAIAIYAAVVAASAWLLTQHVPTVVADPTNFGAWVWIILAVVLVVGSSANARMNS